MCIEVDTPAAKRAPRTRAAKVAQQLEDAAHSGRITRGPELVDSLEDELRLLIEAIHNCRS